MILIFVSDTFRTLFLVYFFIKGRFVHYWYGHTVRVDMTLKYNFRFCFSSYFFNYSQIEILFPVIVGERRKLRVVDISAILSFPTLDCTNMLNRSDRVAAYIWILAQYSYCWLSDACAFSGLPCWHLYLLHLLLAIQQRCACCTWTYLPYLCYLGAQFHYAITIFWTAQINIVESDLCIACLVLLHLDLKLHKSNP